MSFVFRLHFSVHFFTFRTFHMSSPRGKKVNWKKLLLTMLYQPFAVYLQVNQLQFGAHYIEL